MDNKNKKISLVGVQTAPTKAGGPAGNLKDAIALLDEALRAYEHVDVAVLPEYFYEMDIEKKDTIGSYPKEIIEAFSTRARFYSTYILGGTVLRRKDDGRLYNTALLFDRSGEPVADYDKIHLFDVLNGEGDSQESNYCTRGDRLLIYDADFGRVGVITCYDIRFPELARTLALRGVEYLLVPAAFYSPRQDHWTNLLSSIALHNSFYVLAVNLYGAWDPKNVFCGRSLIADPWGVVKAQASDKADIIQAYVDGGYPKEIRDRVGSFHNRVPSVYDIPGA